MSTPSVAWISDCAVHRVAGDGRGAVEFGRDLAGAGDGADVETGVDESLADHAAEPAIGAQNCDLGHFSSPCLCLHAEYDASICE